MALLTTLSHHTTHHHHQNSHKYCAHRQLQTETSAGPDVSSLAFECLSEDIASVLPLVADVLIRPAMPQSRIDLARVQLLDAIEHQNDSPGGIPRRELAKLIYGQASVHARTPSMDNVASMSRAELVQFLKTWQRPDASILGITGAVNRLHNVGQRSTVNATLPGDFDASSMKRMVLETLGSWQTDPSQPATPPSLPNTPLPPPLGQGQGSQPIVYLVDKPGLTQAAVAMGEV